ncbi:dTDP-4-dehydrorhamnose 3 5-epimerase [Paramagnetospirillum magnetotacticum MS-1]|uniref:dTDP-4-dehydrorhamnose 3,5-epimerase n=1 Tax=Paramagnetospirillum magnetotacticum MS-1 TaxID=272627 RepID=A0A0C2YVR6_PARME|nr:dTDP-4-dehydrorhamnose 3,5-epimerase [Paramagnetospirillum magnetotacticum]KIL99198.1 dTDP-4-dehydrorhamnose 3 5-epimerase [Paramagnetospirillum magnetotacticum MS-1]
MKVEVQKTPLDGVLLITPPTIFEDFRGHYIETYNRELYNAAGITVDFVQDDISVSQHNVLRGIHGDGGTWKLVSCLHGRFYLAVVNNDPDSPQYRKWTGFTLSDTNRHQVLIPPKFGNGHLVLSDWAIFHYKQNSQYDRSSQFTILWNDPAYGIWWPRTDPILSRRDQGLD